MPASWHTGCERVNHDETAPQQHGRFDARSHGAERVGGSSRRLPVQFRGQVRDAGVAEDLVQDTFLAAFKARDRFAGQSSERTWLVGILRHKIYDHLRRACRERAVRVDRTPAGPEQEAWDDAVLWMHEVTAECQSPSRRLELEEFRANLETALGKLPPRVAQVFKLYEVEERPNREVCQRLNISEANLWVMLHRARKQLRGHLTGWWSGDSKPNTLNQ